MSGSCGVWAMATLKAMGLGRTVTRHGGRLLSGNNGMGVGWGPGQ